MTTTYTLTVNSQDGSTTSSSNISTDDPAMLQRLLALAGVEKPVGYVSAPGSQPIGGGDMHGQQEVCDVCGHQDCQCDHDMMETADNDYSMQELDDQGEPVDVDTYTWNGPKEPQRIAHVGNNPLAEQLHSQLQASWQKFLAEEFHNQDGQASPLTDPTKPEFDKDPFAGDKPQDDGSKSPMSTIRRQKVSKE